MLFDHLTLMVVLSDRSYETDMLSVGAPNQYAKGHVKQVQHIFFFFLQKFGFEGKHKPKLL